MKMLTKWTWGFYLVLSVFFINNVSAQSSGSAESTVVEANAPGAEIEMADRLRADGKIYIVVGCVLVVLAGMLVYLISLDKKVSNLERQLKS